MLHGKRHETAILVQNVGERLIQDKGKTKPFMEIIDTAVNNIRLGVLEDNTVSDDVVNSVFNIFTAIDENLQAKDANLKQMEADSVKLKTLQETIKKLSAEAAE